MIRRLEDRATKNEAGFTLLELTGAMTLLAALVYMVTIISMSATRAQLFTKRLFEVNQVNHVETPQVDVDFALIVCSSLEF